MADEFILETHGLTKEFAGFFAVRDVALKVRRGHIHALIGPNGAGKTTCFNLLTKFLKPSAGTILYKGRDITAMAPADVARLGLVRSFQISAVFPHLTALENVRVALQRQHGSSFDFWRSKTVLNRFNERALAAIGHFNRRGLCEFAQADVVEKFKGAAVEAVEHRFGAPEIEGMAVLTLQRDPDIFQRGQVRKHSRNLERTHQPQARHVGRRHRRDVLSLVENLAGRRLQELGQEIEARGFAGPVRTDQRVNAATADPKINIANSEETREFLGQSAGFENELISQSNFPHQPLPRSPRAWPIFPNRQALIQNAS